MSDPHVTALIKMIDDVVEAKGTHGGRRAGAGRKKSGKKLGGPHRARPSLSPRHPVHVVLRTERWVPRLRERRVYRVLRRVLTRYLGDPRIRIVHLSIQHNHLHLLVEAKDRRALTRGMQSFAINAARALNAHFGSTGKVFAHRYHATQITSARQARNSLAYVLNNWRRHREDLASWHTLAAKLDPYASGLAFTGWARGRRFVVPPGFTPLPVAPPQTSLLRTDWRRHGLLDPFEIPGPVDGRSLGVVG